MSESFEIQIRSSVRDYEVRIGRGLSRPLLDDPDLIVVCDDALAGLFPWLSHGRSIAVPAAEGAKTLETVTGIIEQMRDLGAHRQSRMLAIGGGIIQDVATASASLYMRGIGWSYCPTTLLGMVDSCIGGKSSINVGRYKNIAGNFFPPDAIVVDTDFCQSLPPVQRVAGLCEAVKICFASRGDAFDRYLAQASRRDLLNDVDALTEVIALTLTTKKAFIEEDEFDQGVRLLLNFGHTFGHALEAASDFEISHGVAVGLGMLAALDFSETMGWIAQGHPRSAALAAHVRSLLAQVPDLNRALQAISSVDALARFKLDKKHRQGEFAVIVLDGSGFLVRRFLPINADTERQLVHAFDSLKA